MDFLKSTLASAISKGPPFPYTFHDHVTSLSIWKLYSATAHTTSGACSIFAFEINDSTRSRLPLAQNAVRRWRTLRHPGVVRVLDSVETDNYIYVATEKVVALGWHLARASLGTETIKWGLWAVAITLKFMNEEAASIHGNVRADSVFTSESGEWKIAGFETFSSAKDDQPFICKYGELLPDSSRYVAPEVQNGGWESLKSQPSHLTDSWGFGILIYEAFNGFFNSKDQLIQPNKVPADMVATYKRLTLANPKVRLSVVNFLDQGRRSCSFFDTPLIHISELVENMGVTDQGERENFLDELERVGDQFPEDFFKLKVLPELLKSVEFSGGGSKVFGAVLRIGDKLNEEEWESSITTAVVRLFALPDRATRIFLLDSLPGMIDHLSKKVINDKIFPEMLTGFLDIAPMVREQTLKAVLIIVPKLSDRNMNGDLLKHLAKTQNDEQPGIRTNTTICLGKIAKYLGQNTRQKVLVAAFTRSLRDPFMHARNAALLALAATSDVFDETDCASKVIPAISPSLVDKEKTVRVQAQKTLDIYFSRIKTLTANYPDTELPNNEIPAMTVSTASPTVVTAAIINPTVTGAGTAAADGWAGWAISSFTKKMASSAVSGEIEHATSLIPRPSSTSVQPIIKKSPNSVSSTPTMRSITPIGCLNNDDDEGLESWGEMNHTVSNEQHDSDSRAEPHFNEYTIEPASMKNVCTVKLEESTGAPSQFGPKPFNLRQPKKQTEPDFEAIVAGRKMQNSILQKKSPVGATKKVPVRKEPLKKVPVKKMPIVVDDDDAWGEAWDG